MVNRLDLFRDGDVGFMVSLDERCPNSLWVDYGRGAGVGRGLGDGTSLGDAQYLPPLSKAVKKEPPQTIISLPVQIVVCEARAEGTLLVVLVAVQLSMLALYLPPVFKSVLLPTPPQTIISLPVHTAVWALRPSGTFVLLVAVQVSVPGLYLPPLLT